jgi:hypothetical protein
MKNERSLAVMAVIALLPGPSTVIGVSIAWLAILMILGYDAAALPRRISCREVGVDRLARLIGLVVPHLRWVKRLVRPRWPMPFRATKRLTGIVMLLVGATLILPVPSTQVVPAPGHHAAGARLSR